MLKQSYNEWQYQWIDNNSYNISFASDQILSLDEDQIEKILYLAAVVSSADHFESARDGDGHYKLDSHIEFTHFSFVLESLSFHYPDGENKNFWEH